MKISCSLIIVLSYKVKGKLGKFSVSTFQSGQYFETFQNEIAYEQIGMEGVLI